MLGSWQFTSSVFAPVLPEFVRCRLLSFFPRTLKLLPSCTIGAPLLFDIALHSCGGRLWHEIGRGLSQGGIKYSGCSAACWGSPDEDAHC